MKNKFKDITVYLCIQMTTNSNTRATKIPKEFTCERCDFKCFKKGDWSRHILTIKHINSTKIINATKNINTDTCTRVFECKKCNNSYKYNSGLSRHYKTCSPPQNIEITELKELIVNQINVNLKLLGYLQTKHDYQSVETDTNAEKEQ
jgi:hypothetical protein